MWDPAKRMKVGSTYVSKESVRAKRGGASSLSNLPASKQSRCICVNPDYIAIAGNDGTVSLRKHDAADEIVKALKDSKEWIEVMAFSPCNTMLAVGSHDNGLYIYNVADGAFTLKGTHKKHSSYIMALDWSKDG
jgi:WD40 repeat protein